MNTAERLTLDRLNEFGCVSVLCAMLRQMSKEFQSAYAHYLEDPYDAAMYIQYNNIRKEFLSEYFHGLTHLNGRQIIERLEQIVRDNTGHAS